MNTRLLAAAVGALAVVAAAQDKVLSTDWPQWRGPTRDGYVTGASWPQQLQGALSKQWRAELGPGYSSPIVLGDRVFTTETVDKEREVVRAWDRRNGRELWRHGWEGALSVPFFARANGSWIRATPATDGERLYVAGMRDVLVCLDVQDGKELWRVDFVATLETPKPAFGFVSSPLVDGDHVYVQAGAGVVKLDKRTGKIQWQALKDQGGMWGSAFSSPVLATLGGRRQLVVLTREKLAGIDLDRGTALWEQAVEAFRGMNILTPVISGDRVFTAAYGGRTHLYHVRLTGESLDVSEAWNYKTQGYMSTPVVVRDHVWLHLRNQRVACLDLRTGREQWTTGKSFGKYWSQITDGDRILALDQKGVLYLLQGIPESFAVLDSYQVSNQETWAHLVPSRDQLFIRELHGLAAWQWRQPPAQASAPSSPPSP